MRFTRAFGGGSEVEEEEVADSYSVFGCTLLPLLNSFFGTDVSLVMAKLYFLDNDNVLLVLWLTYVDNFKFNLKFNFKPLYNITNDKVYAMIHV
jgi:hypothetical protein